MEYSVASTARIAGLFALPLMSEPVPRIAERGAHIYIGVTKVYKLPVFLDMDSLVNPHIAIVGATGTGKTYLLRSIIAKFASERHNSVLLIDWNGEYTEITEALGGTVVMVNAHMPDKRAWRGSLQGLASRSGWHGVLSVCLTGIAGERARREAATQVLQDLIGAMVGTVPGGKTDIMVVVDEAWKLAGKHEELSQLFREGRKYGFAVAIATQLTNDMDASILANAACRFVFRLPGSDSMAALVAAGLASKSDALEGLGVGSCIMSTVAKNGSIAEFVVERVDGFDLREHMIGGGRMNVRVTNQRLESLVRRLDASGAAKARLRETISSSRGALQLVELTGAMARMGIARAEIVWFLREAGVDDMSIAGACVAAAPAFIGGDTAEEQQSH